MLPALPLIILPPAPRLPSPSRLPRPAFRRRPRYRSRRRCGGLPRARGGGPHPRVLVRVGGYVGDELLRREGEQSRQGERGRGWGEPGQEEVVVGYCVGDLERVVRC